MLVYDTGIGERAAKLEAIGEYCFAILLYWNRVEALLKVLRYFDNIDKEYPDKLFFINLNWGVLKKANENDPMKYAAILGGTPKSLWKMRNEIAHASLAISSEEFLVVKSAAVWLFGQLLLDMPKTYQEAHKRFLEHKKKKLGRT